MNTMAKRMLVGIVSVLFLMSPAFAEDEQSGYVLEEITVTAQRQEESLLEIPISVSVFDTNMLEDYNITSNKDLEVRTPGLQFGLDSPITIRGIGAPLHREGLDLSVAQYSNDLYFREAYGVVSSLYDMDRVEILRGPQGTLYGRNSIGGAINYINKRPEFESGVGLTAEVTNFNGRRFAGFVTGPLNEYLAYRLTAEWQESDGMQENISGPDGNSRGDYNISPQVTFKYGKLNMNLRYANFDADRMGDQRVPVTYPDTSVEFHAEPQFGLPSGERNQFYLYPRSRPPANDGGDLENIIDKNRSERNTVGRDAVNLHVNYQFTDSIALRYIYGTSNSEVGLLNSDFDNSSVVASATDQFSSSNAGVPFNEGYIDAYFYNSIDTHELQLTYQNDRVFVMFGLFDLFEGINNDFNVFDTADPLVYLSTVDVLGAPISAIFGSDPAPLGPGVLASSFVPDGSGQWLRENQKKEFESQAVFAQVNFAINNKWAIIAGLRYTDDDKTTVGVETFVAGRNGPFPFPARLDITEGFKTLNFTKTTGNVTLEYTSDGGQLIYGRLATGYKAGAIVAEREPPLDTVDPEELVSLELGYKADMLDNRLRLLVSGYLYDFRSYQQIIYTDVLVPFPRNIAAIQNVPDTDVRGFEIEGTFHVTEDFSVSGFVALQTSKIGPLMATENRNPDQVFRAVPYTNVGGEELIAYLPEVFDFTGNDLPNMPNEKFSVNGDYRMDLADNSELKFSLSYSWTGDRHSRLSNLKKDALDGFGRWDGSITWKPVDKDLEVSLFVENITDVIGIQELESNTFAAGYAQDATLTNPRYFGLVVRWVRS